MTDSIEAASSAQATGRGASPAAIAHHYDVSNGFYQLWLDPALVYSCALWEQGEPDTRLEAAQLRKLDYHIAQVHAGQAQRILDVGCGWGALVRRLVETHGVRHATGLTLSPSQAAWCAARPDPRSAVLLESWLDHAPVRPYDAIISIGAFEHFARAEWPDTQRIAAYRAFFGRCRAWLKPGGRLALQTIAYGNVDVNHIQEQADTQFFFKEIFPESVLPTLADIVAASDGLFEVINLRNDRDDYYRTCRVWYKRLAAKRTEALEMVGEEVLARYLRYLKLSAVVFNYGYASLFRITLRRWDDGPK